MCCEQKYEIGQMVTIFRYLGADPLIAEIEDVHLDGSLDLVFQVPGNTYRSTLYSVHPSGKQIGARAYFVAPGTGDVDASVLPTF